MFTPTQAPLTYSQGFYAMVQVFALILLIFVMLLFLILLITYLNTMFRVNQKDRLKQSIEKAVKEAMSVKSGDVPAHEILRAKELFNRRGLAILAEVFTAMDSKDKRKLKGILLKMDMAANLVEQLKSDNEDYLVEIIHLINEMALVELADVITGVMYEYKENISVQYEAFYALARFGSFDNIIKICKDKDYKQALSFRSLQEIIDAYNGDKTVLYKELLDSPDAYITRICIKHIGRDNIRELAPNVEPFLESGNINLIIDAMRTLSMIGYKQVDGKFIEFLADEHWEIRGVAVNALAALDTGAYIDHFIKALQDSEWQVRYNAGLALSKIKDDGTILKKVIATGDKFAIDMMEYMTNLVQIGAR